MIGLIPKPNKPVNPFPNVPDVKDLIPKGLDRPGQIIQHLADIVDKEKDAVLNNIQQQIDKYINDLKRFDELVKAKVYKELEPVLDAKNKLNNAIKKLKKSKETVIEHYKNLKAETLKTLQTIRTDVGNYIYEELHLDKIKEFKGEINKYKTTARVATQKLAELGLISKGLQDKLAKLVGTDPATKKQREALQKAIDEQLKLVGIQRDKITKSINKVKEITTKLKRFKDEINKISKASIMENIKRGLSEIGLDIEKARAEASAIINEMKNATDLLANGYTKLYETLVIGEDAEKISELWKSATDRTGVQSGKEMKAMAKELEELDKLAKFEDKEAFLKLATKYSAPSRRMFIQTREEFYAIKEGSKAKNILAVISEYADAVLKAMGDSVKILGTYIAEQVIGVVGARAVLNLSKVYGKMSASMVKLAASWQEGVMAGVAIYYLIKDGFTFRALDETIMTITGISIKPLQFAASRLKNDYNDETTVKSVSEAETKTAVIDSKELKDRLDFWGKAYVDELKWRNKHYTDYVPMKKPIVYQRIVGKYINNKKHPYDTDAELLESQRMENELKEIDKQNAKYFEGLLDDGSDVFKNYPIKKGFTRNLANFPCYQRTFEWPPDKHSKGSLHQTQGVFNKSDIDNNLIELFEGWVKSGKYGPIYSKAETKETKQLAINSNISDYNQWLDPRPDKGTFYTEINEWAKRGKGALSIYYNDMIILAPDSFDWGKDDPPESRPWYKKFTYRKYWINTFEYFLELQKQIGRWTYGKNHLEFYTNVVEHDKIYCNKSMHLPHGGTGVWGEYRKPTKKEKKLFSDILKRGKRQKKYLEDISQSVSRQWQQSDVTDAVWNDYRRDIGVDNPDPSKSERNAWTYVYKYRSLFLNELENKVRQLMQERKNMLMQDYKRVIDDNIEPLNLKAASRTFFMGQLNSVAFADKPEFTAEQLILQNFKSITQNILVTKKGILKPWAKRVTSFSTVDDETDTSARIFVTSGPTEIIIVFYTPENEEEDVFDITHTESIFLLVDEIKIDKKTKLRTPNLSIVHRGEFSDIEMIDRDDIIQVRLEVWNQWVSIENPIMKRVTNLILSTDIENVFLTGYGRSAEVAQIAALRLPRSFMRKKSLDDKFRMTKTIVDIKDPHCYLFASRYIGDRRFAINFGSLSGEVVHVWIDGDLNVQLPPIILPDKEKFPSIFEKHLNTLKIMSEKYHYFAGELFLLKTAFGDKNHEIGQYVNMIENVDQRVKYGDYNMNRLEHDMEKILKSNIHFQGYRGNGIFLRLNESGSGAYETNHADPGNSSMSLGHLVKNKESISHLKRIHSLKEILRELLYEINQHAEDFELTRDGMAKWDADGEINAPPKPRKGKGLPANIIDDLINGKKRIVGYAHTKHHHPSGSIVPKSDVDDWMTLPGSNPLDLFNERARNKRRKVIIDTGSDYHGGYY